MKQLMKSMEANPMRLLAGACSLVLTLCLSQAGIAQQTAGAATAPAAAPAKTFSSVAFSSLAPGAAQVPAKAAAEEEEETAKPQKPGSEGLKVHGHWKIVARNPDGTVAKAVEFENALVTNNYGDLILASLLSGQAAVGEWSIVMSGGSGLCADYCLILTSTATTDQLGHVCALTSIPCFAGLTETITPSTAVGVSTALAFGGSFTAASAGSITEVATQPSLCVATTAQSTIAGTTPYTPALVSFTPQNCQTAIFASSAAAYTSFSPFLTQRILASAFTFAAGQLIQVSVTLSFS